ncbi:MAG: Malonyl-[acyl-carrier protein] O-methyltransferase [Legionellaceae bacterium]
MLNTSSKLDIRKIIHHFNQAAETYPTVSILQKEVGLQLIQRLSFIKIEPKTILDLGCGTGFFTPYLKKCFPNATIISLDIAFNMLTMAKKKAKWFSKPSLICAASGNLPFSNHSIDFIFCNQVFHWDTAIQKTLLELKRILTPNGLLLFSTLGPDTLKELRFCWQEIDSYQHIHTFLDMHDIGDMLVQTGFYDPVMDSQYMTLAYKDIHTLFHELKANGASNASLYQNPSLSGKNKLANCSQKYENFRTAENRLPATFEILFGHAWQPLPHNQNTLHEIGIPLSAIKKRLASEVKET